MSDVVKLGTVRAAREGDNSLWSVEECLEEALAEVRSGEREADGCIIIFLNRDGGYDIGWQAANARSSEMISAIEVTKTALISDMGF